MRGYRPKLVVAQICAPEVFARFGTEGFINWALEDVVALIREDELVMLLSGCAECHVG